MRFRSKPNRAVEAPDDPEHDGGELPEGWASAVLSSLCERQRGVSYGRDDARSEPADGLKPILRANNIDGDRLNFNDLVYVPSDRVSANQQLRPGDVVIAMSSGSKSVVGKTAQIFDEWDGSFGAFCGALRPHSEMDARYFGLFLRTREYRQAISELSAGTNINNLKAEHFDAIQVPIAPLAEQRRIVGKLELLLGKVSSSQQRLSRVPGLLKRFRQSVLAAACSGKLTADWREENDEPEVELDGDAIVSVEHLPLIPNTWTYRRAAEVVAKGTVISYGMVLPGPNQPEGVPYIRGQDIDDSGNVHVDQLWKTTPQIAAKHRRSELLSGDVLLCVIRHLRVAIVPNGLDGANLTQGTVRLRPSSEILGPYLARYLASPHAQEWMKARYIGMAMPRINVEHARDVPITLPPLSEQQEIVRRVEKLFAFADQIESRLRQAQAHVDRLTQSLLSKAFRGELVPTEHALATAEGRSYESATELLARIQADHEKGNAPTKTITRKRAITRK